MRSFDIGNVIKSGFRVIGANWILFLAVAALLIGLPNYVSAWLLFEADPAALLASFLSAEYWLSMALLSLFDAAARALIVVGALATLRGENPAMGRLLADSLRLFPSALGIMILCNLFVIGGLILLIVPGIILMIVLIVAVPAQAAEARGVSAASVAARS